MRVSTPPGSPDPSPADGERASDVGVPGAEDIAALSYEQARDELVRIVARLEAGQVGLEDSLALWQRGELLATRCSQWLDGAEAQLDSVARARS